MKNTWSREYEPLSPADFALPLTPEKRVRVAAAVATMCRDAEMFGGKGPGPNAETIRGILVMTEEEWTRDVIGADLDKIILYYDPVSPRTRHNQMASRIGGAS